MRISTMSLILSDGKREKKIKNKKRNKRGGSSYRCRSCRYRSNRQYNVIRHEKRIHQNVRPRKCCGLELKTKYDWYVHCDAFHPDKRATSFTSKEKYQIIVDPILSEQTYRNLRERKEKLYDESPETPKSSFGMSKRVLHATLLKEMGVKKLSEVELEDVPLIYLMVDPDLREELQGMETDSDGDETSESESEEENNSQNITEPGNFSSQEKSSTDGNSDDTELQSHENSSPRSFETSAENLSASFEANFSSDDCTVPKHWHEILRLNFNNDDSSMDFYNNNKFSIFEHPNAQFDCDEPENDKENCFISSSHLPLKKRIVRREKIRQNLFTERPVEVQIINEISLIEITNRQRDYVSFIDFEQYKVL